jgi:hypothetical protein
LASLEPNDFKKIITQSLIYIYRSNENNILDECCGFWTFLNLNDKNELIISSCQKDSSEIWALEWYSRNKGGFGWFPFCDKNYHLRNVEYSVILVDNESYKKQIQTAEILFYSLSL